MDWIERIPAPTWAVFPATYPIWAFMVMVAASLVAAFGLGAVVSWLTRRLWP